MGNAQTILIVEDELLTIELLRAHLLPAGYGVLEAKNGEEAMRIVQNRPDLILLDVMMPGLDGIETCRLLKADEATKDIPVIFLSALQDAKSKTQGLEVGGVDFVSKPFDARELLARVRTHLTIKAQERELKEYAVRLEEMFQERTRQLIYAERLATYGTFAAATVHEINSPNTCISGYAELGKLSCQNAKDILQSSKGADLIELRKSMDEVEGSLNIILEGSHRITEITSTLRSYAKKGQSQRVRCSLMTPINDAIAMVRHRLKKGFSVELSVSPELQLDCDPQKLSQVFVNLLNNAMDAMEEGQGKIFIEAGASGEEIVVQVRDNGSGIPDAVAGKIFEPFYTTKGEAQGTGLGLFIVRNIIEEHKGKISLLPNHGTGASLWIRLPFAEKETVAPFNREERSVRC